ncbi:sulfur carrier protein ThiS [Pseudoalteromonas sp. SMS1]|uniref:sulfur carrier protein ThiS n=1 Tax=Pseudoalteromonas sp. SMS1 TaxID=2908894 RepID=UPI001F315287|nr:sulfur carrier protein ThiS [Pseudoalteromonas sp. SMS1]MCF2858491.1 sulfur carrier protein ThiS [Pseudoalteromonas sp. SMS1]
MNIVINGEPKVVHTEGLQDVLHELGYQNKVIVTALNGHFVSEPNRQQIQLKEGDKVEVLAPMQGG